jgi:hypothetical protein
LIYIFTKRLVNYMINNNKLYLMIFKQGQYILYPNYTFIKHIELFFHLALKLKTNEIICTVYINQYLLLYIIRFSIYMII